jgi:hypothetical protein
MAKRSPSTQESLAQMAGDRLVEWIRARAPRALRLSSFIADVVISQLVQ